MTVTDAGEDGAMGGVSNYLLTWYGITDLRASLGFEQSDGPVLAALNTREFTHVLVLAYTDPTKVGEDALRAQDEWCRRVEAAASAGSDLARNDRVAAVDALANTPKGHQLFREWLHAQIKARGLGVAIRVVERELASLCDAKGTYAAASEALDVVLGVDGDKEIAVYLSPGTPVMAFTWAFVSLVNPEVKVRLVAAPDHRKDPEEVRLPYDLLVPSSRKRRVVQSGGAEEFDTVFHLFGEQRLPSLLGILQFPSRRHVFVTSPKYPAGYMGRFMPVGVEFGQLSVNPFDPMSTNVAILRAIAERAPKGRIGFNLTGGTKLMFAGAQAACRKVDGVPFYFETRDHTVVFLDNFATMAVRGVDDVEKFVELSGFPVSRRGFWNDEPIRERRREFTHVLWRERSRIAKLYRDLSGVIARRSERSEFRIEKGPVCASLNADDEGYLRVGKQEYIVERCPDFAAYLCGGWLEEYVYCLLEPLLLDGTLRDLRIGLEVAWAPSAHETAQHTAQEFDVTFTDGKRLFIIECKAGGVISEDVYRLENSVRNYGGIESRGILVSAFPPPDASRRRLRSGKNLSYCAGRGVPDRLIREVKTLLRSDPR